MGVPVQGGIRAAAWTVFGVGKEENTFVRRKWVESVSQPDRRTRRSTGPKTTILRADTAGLPHTRVRGLRVLVARVVGRDTDTRRSRPGPCRRDRSRLHLRWGWTIRNLVSGP